jgi:Rrf2 family transcriptional regulator, cysteine metabolism repressor
MKLSTKGRYGTRALVELARRYGEGPVLLKDIAEQQQVSLQYLHHIVNSLVSAGLLKSTRGVGGGVWLARPPSEIKLSEVINVLEGETSPVRCVEDPETCKRSCTCAVRDVWTDIKVAVDGVLDSITLKDMVNRQKSKESGGDGVYYI